jgi:hypothetical protein
MDEAAISALVEIGRDRPSSLSSVDLWMLGGAMGRVGATDTPIAHRDADYMVGLEANWDEPAGDNVSTAGVALLAVQASRERGEVVRAEAVWSGVYRRAQVDAELFARFGDVRFTPRVRLGWGEDLPLQRAFPLGGLDGFPGLHIGERRGDREAMLGIMLTAPVKGPLLARVELAGGRTANGGSLLGADGWVGGIRAGIFTAVLGAPYLLWLLATQIRKGAM